MITFDVYGTPAPQGSKRAMQRPGMKFPVLVDGGSDTEKQKTAVWRTAVHTAARQQRIAAGIRAPLDEALSIEIEFRMPPPETDKYRTRCTVKPDIDKLLRSTFDALTSSGIIHDDARIYAVSAAKLYARGDETPGATITIWAHGSIEQGDREELKSLAKQARKGARLS